MSNEISDKTESYDAKETKETAPSAVSFLAPGIGNRISAASERVGARTTAAKAMQVSTDSLQRYIREERMPGIDAAAGLCVAAKVSMDWLAFDLGPMDASQTALTRGSQTAEQDPAMLGDAIAAVRAVEAALNVELTAKAMGKVVLLACDHIKAGKTAAQLVAAITQAVRGSGNE